MVFKINIELLKKFGNGEIFASGYLQDVRIAHQLVKWVAVSGNNHYDWAVYYGYPDMSNQKIADSGSKMFTLEVVKELVPCDEEAFKMYRM